MNTMLIRTYCLGKGSMDANRDVKPAADISGCPTENFSIGLRSSALRLCYLLIWAAANAVTRRTNDGQRVLLKSRVDTGISAGVPSKYGNICGRSAQRPAVPANFAG